MGQLLNGTIYERISKSEKRERQRQLNEERNIALESFCKAAAKFSAIGEYVDAGKCYFSGRNYKAALESFTRVRRYREMAQCCFKLGRFVEAATLFLKNDDAMECIESLEAAQ